MPTTPVQAKTLMLVDDDRDTLFLVRQILQQHGYQVLFARGGEAALQVCRMHVGPLDLLITDVVMPGMSGQQLAERLKSIRPGLRTLFISGIMNAASFGAQANFLTKPFSPEQLLSRVQALLAAA